MRYLTSTFLLTVCVIATGCTTTTQSKPTAGEIALKENLTELQKSTLPACKGGVQMITLNDGTKQDINKQGCR